MIIAYRMIRWISVVAETLLLAESVVAYESSDC